MSDDDELYYCAYCLHPIHPCEEMDCDKCGEDLSNESDTIDYATMLARRAEADGEMRKAQADGLFKTTTDGRTT
jgi:hypothetical protein